MQAGIAVLNTPQSGLYYDGITKKGPGHQLISAQYGGDQTFMASSSKSENVIVDRWPVTGGYITGNPNPIIFCQPLSLTALVFSNSPYPPSGEVKIDIKGLGGLEVGEYTYYDDKRCEVPGSGEYLGDGYTDWGLIGTNEVVNPSTTTTSLKSSKNPSHQGQSVTFGVALKAPYANVVDGSVTFTSGGNVLGTVALKNSRGTISTSSLPVGQDTITATYTPGNGNFLGSSASLVQTVQEDR